MSTPLIKILLVDGTTYLIAFLLTYVLVIVFTSGLLNTFPNLMLSRFMFNLRHASADQMTDNKLDQQDSNAVGFTSGTSSTLETILRLDFGTIGNMGAPLSHGSSEYWNVNEGLEEMTCNEELIENAYAQDIGVQHIQEGL
ncbi:hypothetical protein WOLCODRAFT_20468 [Wolfiporia cocos MD-104 SS10]|uniref:Uncharacterized protein n=1 Tax=Wolfiporia cocos (strain MD-104) TaxID=742152 RepID=A0A2H3J3Q3_WOLCO|nr:hypothetical protein WOLCODRAFT_20468 [Wolfiporia cocos MD-104 SS10]